MDAKATGVHFLHKNDGGRASGSISQLIRGPKTKVLSKTDLDSRTIGRRKVGRQELGNVIQTGEHSSVRLFPFSSYRNYL